MPTMSGVDIWGAPGPHKVASMIHSRLGGNLFQVPAPNASRPEEWAVSRHLEWNIWVSGQCFTTEPDVDVTIHLNDDADLTDSEYFAAWMALTDRVFDYLRDHSDWGLILYPPWGGDPTRIRQSPYGPPDDKTTW